jgi:hypothetical protein
MSVDLAKLVACDRYVRLFPQGMPLRACLRRQLEHQKRASGKGWDPARPFCAGECGIGKELRAKLPEGAAWACTTCGAAVVGATACETCHEKLTLKQVLPRTPSKAPPQERIWTSEVPDTPIAPLPPRAPGLDEGDVRRIARRVARVTRGLVVVPDPPPVPETPAPPPATTDEAPAPIAEPTEQLPARADTAAPANPEPPDDPAQEATMPTEAAERKLCTNCEKNPLRSDNESGICRPCRTAPERNRAEGTPAPKPAKPAVRPKVAARKSLARHPVQLEQLDVPELVALRGDIDGEIDRRLAEAERAAAEAESAAKELRQAKAARAA